LLSLADQALAQAEAPGGSSWVCLEQDQAANLGDDQNQWRTRLETALTQERFQLYAQAVVRAAQPDQVMHYKVISRLLDEHGQPIAAGLFLPWLERFGWAARLDVQVLRKVLEQLQHHHQAVAFNLSAATLADAAALEQVFALLAQHRSLGAYLTLEIGEEQLPGQEELQALTRRLRSLGFSLALQRFGGRFSMIGNLAQLGLAYLKIDGSYIRAIDQDSHKRLFIEAVQRAAHSIDVPLIAERVETRGELQVLVEMGIEGVQGQLFGEPQRWLKA